MLFLTMVIPNTTLYTNCGRQGSSHWNPISDDPTPPTSEEDPRDCQARVDMAPPEPRRENLRGHLETSIRNDSWRAGRFMAID
jgi:hypothetical protein